MATGSHQGSWGNLQNQDVTSVIDLNLGGRLSKSVAGSSNITVSATEAQNLAHTLTGVLTGNIQYILPNQGSFYWITNSTTGAHTITVIGPSGTGTLLPQGRTTIIFTNPDNTTAAPPLDWLPVLTLNNTGLHLYDTDASNVLKIAPGSNLTADRTLTFTTGDADRTVTISSDTTIGVTTTEGDMIVRGASVDQRLAIGAADTILATDGTDPLWRTLTAEIDTLGSTRGMILNRGASSWTTTAVGSANTLLATDGTDPLWRTLTAEIDAAIGSTRGSLLYRGASGWAILTPGTTGSFVTSNGSGADPSYTVIASPVLLNTLTASSSASLSDTTSITGTYRQYVIEFVGFSTSTGPLALLLHGSGSFQTTGYNNFLGAPATTGGSTAGTDTSIPLIPAGIANINNATVSITLYGTATGSIIQGRSTYYYFDGGSVARFGMSDLSAQFVFGTCDGFKLQPASGTLSSGTIYVYGVP